MKLLPRQSLSIVFIYSFFISHVHLLDVFEHTERKYEDAAFVEVASCLCDMTGDTCDINCCCDKDCSVEDLQAFTCASAISGRKITNNNLVDWKCAHMNSTRHFDLHPFLCIQKENSPFLGYYFKDFPARKDLPSLNDLILRKIKPPQSTWHPVRDWKMSLSRKLRAASQYIFGQEIEVVVTASSGTKISKLAVPINLYRGNCDIFRRVKYLEDLKSVCSIEIKKLCASQFVNDSVLSVRTFAFGDHGRLNLFSRPGEEKFLTDMNITYLCAVNVCCYLKNKFCNSSVNCSNVLPCQGDSANNGPILSEGICHRTVLEVHYEFFWRGGKISYLKIRIILGNVPVEDEKGHVPSILTQHFSVSFKYASKMNESGAQFEMLNLTTYKRSGNPGYEISHPLVGAMITDNSLELEPDQLRENGTLIKNYLFTWKKGK